MFACEMGDSPEPYSSGLSAASTSDSVAKPSNRAVTVPSPSITKVHSMLGSGTTSVIPAKACPVPRYGAGIQSSHRCWGMFTTLRLRRGAGATGDYSSGLSAASTSDSVANPSNRAVTVPSPSMTKVHSMLGSDHSVTAGDIRALSRSPWISWGLS